LVVYDVTKEQTFVNAKTWLDELRAQANQDCIIYLVGNQVDRCQLNEGSRQVKRERAEQFAKEEGIYFEETSALTDFNVKSVFENLLNRKQGVLIRVEMHQLAVEKQRAEMEENEVHQQSRKYKKLEEEQTTAQPKQSGCC